MATQMSARPFSLRRTPVPGEYTGRVWLLKRDDPDVWFGTETGIVFTGTVYPGGDFREDAFLRPRHMKEQRTVQANGQHFGRTLELTLNPHGALARTAKDGPGRPITMKAFYHPSGSCCVAGWDPVRRQWVVE